MAKQTIYTVGGTVQAGGGIYIKRKADDNLLEFCRAGELAFILSSRQVGKSSLMTQTAEQLGKENIRSATVDLSSIGTKVTQEEWYLGILNVIATDLNLETNIFTWWTRYSGLGPAQRFFNFLRDVVLKEIKNNIVLFFDEIDTTLSIPFADDFFATVRSIYNARSTTPDFKRLSFVLVGVAMPSDLISDSKRTPFNIGHRVDLNDFTLQEAMPLAQGLGENAEQALAWVLDWSGGHPYLTQRLCAQLSKSKKGTNEQAVATVVEQLFIGEQGQQDNNLQFVRDMLVERSPDSRKVMIAYRDIRSGKKVVDDERSIPKSHLKISGVVRRQDGMLVPRNRIYERVFDLDWIKENFPSDRKKTIIITSIFLILSLVVLFSYDLIWTTWQLDQNIKYFDQAGTPKDRLKALAYIFDLHGILPNSKDYDFRAQDLFFSLQETDQMEIFSRTYGEESYAELPTVIKGLYVTFAEVDDTGNSSKLLELMRDSLISMNTPEALSIRSEITSWLDGRHYYRQGEIDQAVSRYSLAIDLNKQNPATLYERAKSFIAKKDYQRAISDLDKVVAIARSRISENQPAPVTSPTITTTPEVHNLNTGFKTKFSSLTDIANAIRDLFDMNPKLLAAVEASNNEFPNLTSIGINTASTRTCDSAQFVADVSVPDGSTIDQGVTFTKTFRLKNIGTCTWTTAYSMVFDSGTKMGSTASVPFPSNVAPGGTIDLSISMTAPNSAGHYIGYWKFKNASGVLFGIGFNANKSWWVEINVTGTSETNVVYDFTANAKSASWSSGTGGLSFPGTDGEEKGFALKIDKPRFESGVVASQPGLLVSPQQITNGYIQASYPAFRVQNGDRFQTTIGCENGATSCYIAYRLDYEVNGFVRTYWQFREYFDGLTYNANLNLSSLAGQNIKFILYVSAWGSPVGDRALWGNPVITRSGGGVTPTPTATGTPATPTPTSTAGPPTVPPSSCERAQFIADVTVPEGTVILPDATFTVTWRLKNVGSCAWSTSYQLVFVSGEQMGAPASTSFAQNVPVGQTVDISVNMTAPSAPGSYRGYWMFKDASGALFGTGAQANRPWWVDISVSDASSAATNVNPIEVFTLTP
jgi:tetratricopeptide (TPR) repeat protein